MTINNVVDFLLHPLIRQFVEKEAELCNDCQDLEGKVITITPIRVIAFIIFAAALKKEQRIDLFEKIGIKLYGMSYRELMNECDWSSIFEDIGKRGVSLTLAVHQRTDFNHSLESNGFKALNQALLQSRFFMVINDSEHDLSVLTSITNNLEWKSKWQQDEHQHLYITDIDIPSRNYLLEKVESSLDESGRSNLVLFDDSKKEDGIRVIIENHHPTLPELSVKTGEYKVSRGLCRFLEKAVLTSNYEIKSILSTIKVDVTCNDVDKKPIGYDMLSRRNNIVIRNSFALILPSGMLAKFAIDDKADSVGAIEIGNLITNTGYEVPIYSDCLSNVKVCEKFLSLLEGERRTKISNQMVAIRLGVPALSIPSSVPLPIEARHQVSSLDRII